MEIKSAGATWLKRQCLVLATLSSIGLATCSLLWVITGYLENEVASNCALTLENVTSNRGKLLSSTCKTENMTWLNSGVYWCMWFVETAV
nr:hypothetical protein CFP56_68908 [Quercus suber]